MVENLECNVLINSIRTRLTHLLLLLNHFKNGFFVDRVGVRLQCNGATVLPLHPAIKSTWMDESIEIQQLDVIVTQYYHYAIVFFIE